MQRSHLRVDRWALGVLAALAGCASVPMASAEADAASKAFASPPTGKAGVYVFRNSWAGGALTKSVYLDGALVGETANKVYLYWVVDPGDHTVGTESEFGNNDVRWHADAGKNYFFRQYIKMGVFVGGANLEAVEEEEGKKEVLACKLGVVKHGSVVP